MEWFSSLDGQIFERRLTSKELGITVGAQDPLFLGFPVEGSERIVRDTGGVLPSGGNLLRWFVIRQVACRLLYHVSRVGTQLNGAPTNQ